MKSPWKLDLVIIMALVVLMAAPVYAENARSPIPFGGYLENGKCGCYGAKVPIKTVEEARKIIEEFLVGHVLRIGVIDDRPLFYRAELVDRNGAVHDVVIVNKANGRVRSAY